MELDIFLKTIHKIVGSGTLYDFTFDFFSAAANIDLANDLTEDKIKSWFRSNRRTHSYTKVFTEETFNAVKFNTFLKSKILGKWKDIQTAFNESKISGTDNIIKNTTDNIDEFIESLEWQFKTILRIPIVVVNNWNRITIAGNIETGLPEYNPNALELDSFLYGQKSLAYIDFDETLAFEHNKNIKINKKWIVQADLSIEILLAYRYPELLINNLTRGIQHTYFIYNQNNEQEKLLRNEFLKYGYDYQLVYLSKNLPDKDYFYIPRAGYTFYFTVQGEANTIRGYESHQFYGMDAYKVYRMRDDDIKRKTSILKLIKESKSINI